MVSDSLYILQILFGQVKINVACWQTKMIYLIIRYAVKDLNT